MKRSLFSPLNIVIVAAVAFAAWYLMKHMHKTDEAAPVMTEQVAVVAEEPAAEAVEEVAAEVVAEAQAEEAAQ